MIACYSGQSGTMPGLEDLDKWQQADWAFMEVLCAAGGPTRLPCDSKLSMGIG